MTENELSTIRHSTAHIMAHAVKNLFPEVKIAIGPSIEDGFYYDFDVAKPFTPEDLDKISEEMKKIIKQKMEFECIEVDRAQALEMFADEPYKTELINELPEGEKITVYKLGDFTDLCKGPHVDHSGRIKAFKLLSVAGAYWRGDEKNKMLQRIYGTAFPSKEELQSHLDRLAEAEKRDHRKIGKDLDLFSIQEDVGPGLILWHPKGALLRKTIEDYWRNEHYKNGYELVYTPHIARQELWGISGHLDFFTENMFQPMEVEGSPYLIKPMNCPFHMLIYKTKVRSYREMPIRWAELGTVYRYERSGVLHGLMRVRGFTQDDAHILCTREQLNCETNRVLDFVLKILKRFGFDEYEIFLSTKPEKYVGDDEVWEQATESLKLALEAQNLKYDIDEGGGAFYGPKIDVKIKDAIGRYWQCSTIQVDFNEPERFDITYIGQDNKQHRPIMIHRALLGSLERFMGVLIEHYAGAFPLWLAPLQVRILSIADRHLEYAQKVADSLREIGLRVDIDDRNEKMGFKIREAQLLKIPYMLVVGDKELEENKISVRSRSEGDMGSINVQEFITQVKNEL
ncbi:MAG: threonine--tRNA ligase [Armatimonadota bacterium]